MNKAFGFLSILSVVLLFACKNDPANGNNSAAQQPLEHANATTLAGHWIPVDFCARAGDKGSILKAINENYGHAPFALALSFNPEQRDSVTCHDGTKQFKLAIRVDLDTIELLNAKNGKSVFLVYDPQGKGMEMFDATNGSAYMDRLIKSSSDSPSGYVAFVNALNHHLLEGNFTPIGQKTDKPVHFLPNTYIENFPEYNRYMLCTAGDCFVLGDQMDVITLANEKDKDSKKQFGLKYSKQNDTLTLYNLNMAADGKSAQAGSVAYKFLRAIPKPIPSKPIKPGLQEQPKAN